MDLLVGCPVLFRDWIMPTWFGCVEKACALAHLSHEYVFVGDPVADPRTWEAIADTAPAPVHQVVVPEHERTYDERDWNPRRYHRMVVLRNAMLAEVRRLAPANFLSLDSDILIHPDALIEMIYARERFDAVGSKCFMGSGNYLPSYAFLPYGGGLRREDSTGTFAVEVVMAMVLMGPAAYEVDYHFHFQGEDIGWSLAAKAAGASLGWTGAVTSKHVMEREQLDRMDPRCGY